MKHGLMKNINIEKSTKEISAKTKRFSNLYSLDIILKHLLSNYWNIVLLTKIL